MNILDALAYVHHKGHIIRSPNKFEFIYLIENRVTNEKKLVGQIGNADPYEKKHFCVEDVLSEDWSLYFNNTGLNE